MAGNVIQSKQGADRVQDITLIDGQGAPVTTFTAGAALAAAVWAGDQQEAAFAPTVAWVDAAAGTVRLTFAAADTADLAPGSYPVQLTITASGLVRKNNVATLQILASPGADTAQAVYCTAEQLLNHVPWLDELLGSDDQAGFAEQRAMAREWFDDLVAARYAAESGGSLQFTPYLPGTAYGGNGSEAYIREQLDENKLVVRPWVVRAVSYYAAGEILRHQVGTRDKTSYQVLGDRYMADARDLARQHYAELDVDADGVAEIRVSLGSLRISRG
jgi:hypothetical protein